MHRVASTSSGVLCAAPKRKIAQPTAGSARLTAATREGEKRSSRYPTNNRPPMMEMPNVLKICAACWALKPLLCSIGTMLVTIPTVNDTDSIKATLKPQYIPERNACLKDMPLSSGSSLRAVASVPRG
ncbi:hypothetical protein D3C76_741870 [compost metagenome]